MTELQPFYRGDDHALEVLVRVKSTKEPVDITGWVFTSTLKLSSELPDQPELDEQGNRQVLQVSTVAGDTEDSKNGRVYLVYPSDQTRQLVPTTYEMDIQSERNNITQTLIKSRIPVLSDVSHGEPS